MRVKIAALRDWTDSPFLKFTLVAAAGELWEFIWHTGASVALGFRLVDASGRTHPHPHTHTNIHLSLSVKAHWLLCKRSGDEKESKRRVGNIEGLSKTHPTVSVVFQQKLLSQWQTLFCLIRWRSTDLQDPERNWGVVRTGGVGLGEGRVKFPLYTWKLGKAATQPPPAAGQGPIHSTDAAL